MTKPYPRTLIFSKTTAGSTAIEKIWGKAVTELQLRQCLNKHPGDFTSEPSDCLVFSIFCCILLVQHCKKRRR